jgi:hypothetical protein
MKTSTWKTEEEMDDNIKMNECYENRLLERKVDETGSVSCRVAAFRDRCVEL